MTVGRGALRSAAVGLVAVGMLAIAAPANATVPCSHHRHQQHHQTHHTVTGQSGHGDRQAKLHPTKRHHPVRRHHPRPTTSAPGGGPVSTIVHVVATTVSTTVSTVVKPLSGIGATTPATPRPSGSAHAPAAAHQPAADSGYPPPPLNPTGSSVPVPSPSGGAAHPSGSHSAHPSGATSGSGSSSGSGSGATSGHGSGTPSASPPVAGLPRLHSSVSFSSVGALLVLAAIALATVAAMTYLFRVGRRGRPGV